MAPDSTELTHSRAAVERFPLVKPETARTFAAWARWYAVGFLFLLVCGVLWQGGLHKAFVAEGNSDGNPLVHDCVMAIGLLLLWGLALLGRDRAILVAAWGIGVQHGSRTRWVARWTELESWWRVVDDAGEGMQSVSALIFADHRGRRRRIRFGMYAWPVPQSEPLVEALKRHAPEARILPDVVKRRLSLPWKVLIGFCLLALLAFASFWVEDHFHRTKNLDGSTTYVFSVGGSSFQFESSRPAR